MATDLDNGNSTRKARDALIELLSLVILLGVLNHVADLLDAGLDLARRVSISNDRARLL